MTTWFISRHPGAIQWMQTHGPAYDHHVAHLDVTTIQAGDTVIGTLPINIAAQVCERGAQYWNLSLQMPPHARGQELSAEELQALGTMLERFEVRKLPAQLPAATPANTR
ncbi:MAG: CRISPR-associated protein Csx16 [Comamonadaceae bacterium]|nr:CRISPR-associated protein Csx16 [Comamonadaceae bacterium]